jgi:hypothetical protein
MEVQRTWSEPNAAYYQDKKEQFEKAIKEMDWKLVTSEMQLPLQTGFAIKEFVNKLQLPRVSHVALSDAFQPYGFYGLRTHYGDGQVEIYIIDTGLAGAVICSDKHPMPVDKETLIKGWIEIAKEHSFIKDGELSEPFGRTYFWECITIEELRTMLLKFDWCIGQAYFYKNLCFINRCAGDNWLSIRDNIEFGNISFQNIIMGWNVMANSYNAYEQLIERMLKATPEQLKNLEY